MQMGGKVFAITGAASGIGRELAVSAARSGAKVALLDRDQHHLDELAAEMSRSGAVVAAATVDVSQRNQVQAAVAKVSDLLGPVDIMIPCAGICRASTVDELKVKELEDILKINFLGTVYMIEAVLPSMLERKRGHIVGISSLAGMRGIPFEPGYSASKAAVKVYLESLRRELRPRGIAVTTVFPGYVQTPLLDEINGAMGGDMSSGKACTPAVAANAILRAIERRSPYSFFPFSLGLSVRASMLLPAGIYDLVMGKMFSKLPIYSAEPAKTVEVEKALS